ncbi:MAG TPA: PilZ domain-containing protein [Polyangiaceae bacterium]
MSTARSARENLRQGLAALQAPGVPPGVTQAAEPVAQAMGALHQIEASGGAGLAQHAPVALEAVRRALGMLQGQPSAVPAVSQALEAVAGSLSLVHQLSQSVMVNAATQRQQPSPVAPQPQYQVPAAGYGATMAQAPVPQAPAAQPPQHFAPQGYPPQAPAGFPPAQPQYAQPAPQQYAPQPAAQPQYAQPVAQPQYAQPAPQPPAAQPQYAQPAAQPQYAQPSPQAAAPPQGFAPPPQAAYPPQQSAAAYAAPAAEAPPAQWPQRVSTMPPPPGGAPLTVDAELGAHSATNFYKGLSGNDVVDSGGIFIATYQIPEIGQPLTIKVSLPGGYEFEAAGVVRWTREAPHSTRGVESPPGFGAQFTNISQEGRQLVYRYVRNREPLFHDDL